MLVGREDECARLDRLLEQARGGRSGALVLRGEAGIGKTTLLEYAVERARGMLVTRTVGVESEAELEFSALVDVCEPLLQKLDALSERQAAALRGALGVGPPAPADRLAVAAGTLALLAAGAEDVPILLVVDDAHWVDRSSLEALLFAVRRLRADPVAALFAVRDDEGAAVAYAGVPVLALRGLDREATTTLLAHAAPLERVAHRLHALTGGNPLALLEVPSLLTPEQLSGEAPLPEPLPVGAALEQAYARRAARLPTETRRALVVAAVNSSTDVEPVDSALRGLGLDPSSLEGAEDAGLLRVDGGRVVFPHPLVRSAVFHAARPSERRAAHRALADALAGHARDEERAWHLASSALGPDEEAAAALADAARRARERSGFAAAVGAFEQSARLTPAVEVRATRFMEAAITAWIAGQRGRASTLAQEALETHDDPRARTRLLRGRALDAWFDGRLSEASELLAEVAALAEAHGMHEAVGAFADAVDVCLLARRPETALALARRASELAPRDEGDDDFRAEYALGMALLAVQRDHDGASHLERALAIVAVNPELAGRGRILLRAALAADALGRTREGLDLAVRGVARAREQAAYTLVPHVLEVAARLAVPCGRWSEAYGWGSEALELAENDDRSTGFACLTHLACIDAARGSEERCRRHAAKATETATGSDLDTSVVEGALALLDASLGRLDEAAWRYERLPGAAGPDLVEVYVRLGRVEEARAAAETDGSAHARGLVAGDEEFEALLRDAIERYAARPDVFAAARARLALGERLRRAGRRVDARGELREALTELEALGARPWAERAAVELRATGETLRRREPHEEEELTPQELQIALQVAEGKTNKEVGAALFLSPKTIEFHLKRVYRKLGVRSRGELIRRFATGDLG